MPLKKRRIGATAAWAISLGPILLWAVSPPNPAPGGIRFPTDPLLESVGQLAGLCGMVMLSVAFVLASRARFLEDLFGGLDKMYRVHHQLGLTSFVLLFLHPIAHAGKFLAGDFERFLLFFVPVHEQQAVDYGVFALWILILLMILTFYDRIPYDRWKLSHKALGLVLALGVVHLLGVEPTRGRSVAVAENPLLRAFVLGVSVVGLAAYAYKLIAVPLTARRHRYVVEEARRLNPEVLEVVLRPKRRALSFEPGQFVFVTFFAQGLTRESHPFTICSVPRDRHLTLTIKALGDFTESVHEKLNPGAEAKVEGPYGRFDYRTGSSRQVWLAGGVGVVPFLNWARHMLSVGAETPQVRFYYCVHSRGDAVYQDDFRRLAAELANLEVTLVCSEERGRLRADEIDDLQGCDLFMCGPRRFTTDFQRRFVALGVPRDRIHFEDFEFR